MGHLHISLNTCFLEWVHPLVTPYVLLCVDPAVKGCCGGAHVWLLWRGFNMLTSILLYLVSSPMLDTYIQKLICWLVVLPEVFFVHGKVILKCIIVHSHPNFPKCESRYTSHQSMCGPRKRSLLQVTEHGTR